MQQVKFGSEKYEAIFKAGFAVGVAYNNFNAALRLSACASAKAHRLTQKSITHVRCSKMHSCSTRLSWS
jgi:hypothetical protein